MVLPLGEVVGVSHISPPYFVKLYSSVSVFANSLLEGYPRFSWRRRRAPATSAFRLFYFHKLRIWSIFMSCLHEDIVYQGLFHRLCDSPTKIGRVCSKVGRLRPFDLDVVVAPRTKWSKQLGKRLVCDQKPHSLHKKLEPSELFKPKAQISRSTNWPSWASAHLRKSCSFQIALVLGFSITTNPPWSFCRKKISSMTRRKTRSLARSLRSFCGNS